MNVLYPKVTGALCAKMARGLSGQDGNDGIVLVLQTHLGGGISATLDASYYKGSGSRNGKEREYLVMGNEGVPNRKYIVRRLTPLECCRLQGFPDWWCEGVEGSDSAQYKMWGNGIALPCAYDVMRRIAKEYERGDGNGDDDSGTA